ncbi:MAG: IS1 family transposase [Acidobacteria bacterium]|nr:IS1 family transposase [Acidobacteriota bacterium]
MRIKMDKVLLVLSLLVEGSAVRSIERVTGVHRDTILRLMVYIGERCERFIAEKIKGVPVKDVQADEIWGFVGMKEKTKVKKRIHDAQLGDAYTFVGIERDSKLVLAWHLGRRTALNTDAFMEKLERATSGRFQLTTDGFPAYPDAVNYHLGTRTDYAMLTKKYGHEDKNERRYSPPSIISTEKTYVHGDPNWDRVCTSHVERSNLTMRMHIRRLTRLTISFSRKWKNFRAALALYFAWYNFCRSHRSLSGCTPAMVAGLTRKPWSMAELLAAC